MIIRKVNKSDLNQVVILGEEFAVLSKEIHGFSVNRSKIENFANTIINDSNCIGLVLEDEGIIRGILAAIITTPFFSDDLIVQEMVWYVKVKFGGLKMMSELETEARKRGAVKLIMGCKPQYFDMDKIYKILGYSLLENQYIKKIG